MKFTLFCLILSFFQGFAFSQTTDNTGNQILPLAASTFNPVMWSRANNPTRATNPTIRAAVELQTAPQMVPFAVTQQPVESFFPQLILGGEWTSVIKLTNRSTKAIPLTNVYFLDNVGNSLQATFRTTDGNTITDDGFSFFLNPGGIIEGTFVGGANTQFGHAFVASCNTAGTCLTGLYGEVTLRNRSASRPDFESVFPLEQPAALQYMLFDHRSGVQTLLYVVNENVSTSTVSLEFMSTANQLIRTVTVTIPSLGSQILLLNDIAPSTIGLQGTLVIRGSNVDGAFITATALRINPTNSFTPMRSFIPTH